MEDNYYYEDEYIDDYSGEGLLSESQNAILLNFGHVVVCLIGIITLVGNLMTLVAYVKYRHLRRVGNYFLVSLAVADLLGGVITLLMIVSFGECSPIVENVVSALTYFFVLTSLVHLLLIAIDRYIAINQPLQYESKMTPRRACIILATTWTAMAILCCSPVFLLVRVDIQCDTTAGGDYETLLEIVCYVFTMTTITVVYTKVLLVVRLQRRRIHDMEQSMGTSSEISTVTVVHKIDDADTMQIEPRRDVIRRNTQGGTTKRTNGNKRPIIILLLLILSTFVLWTPHMVYEMCALLQLFDNEQHGELGYVLLILGLVNSAVNTFVYAVVSREFREAYVKIIKCK